MCFLRGKITDIQQMSVQGGRKVGNSVSREEAVSVPAPILLQLLGQVAGLLALGVLQCSFSVRVTTQ